MPADVAAFDPLGTEQLLGLVVTGLEAAGWDPIGAAAGWGTIGAPAGWDTIGAATGWDLIGAAIGAAATGSDLVGVSSAANTVGCPSNQHQGRFQGKRGALHPSKEHSGHLQFLEDLALVQPWHFKHRDCHASSCWPALAHGLPIFSQWQHVKNKKTAMPAAPVVGGLLQPTRKWSVLAQAKGNCSKPADSGANPRGSNRPQPCRWRSQCGCLKGAEMTNPDGRKATGARAENSQNACMPLV